MERSKTRKIAGEGSAVEANDRHTRDARPRLISIQRCDLNNILVFVKLILRRICLENVYTPH